MSIYKIKKNPIFFLNHDFFQPKTCQLSTGEKPLPTHQGGHYGTKAIHNDTPGLRFSGRLVANGAQKWLWATSIVDYNGLHGDSKYLWSCNILDAAKINGMLINISEVLSWLYCIYVNHKSCVCDMFDIARNVAKP